MQIVFSWILKLLGVKFTKVLAIAAIDSLVSSTKTPHDDEIWGKIKKQMDWD